MIIKFKFIICGHERSELMFCWSSSSDSPFFQVIDIYSYRCPCLLFSFPLPSYSWFWEIEFVWVPFSITTICIFFVFSHFLLCKISDSLLHRCSNMNHFRVHCLWAFYTFYRLYAWMIPNYYKSLNFLILFWW